MADVAKLIEEEIPEGRRQLEESFENLERVADYCENNYLEAADKHAALEETKKFTTQSLASVAYQINTLATNFLHLLDVQTSQLAEMEASVSHLSQTVDIHKEKVARREIGVLTANKSLARPPKMKAPGIIFPDSVEKPMKYVRQQIDYTKLDDIGHGIKEQKRDPRVVRQSSTASQQQQQLLLQQQQQQQQQRQMQQQSSIEQHYGSLRGNSHYRSTAPPVQPPSVPSNYASGQNRQTRQYAQGTPVGVTRPMAQPAPISQAAYSPLDRPHMVPPAPPPAEMMQSQELPAPPPMSYDGAMIDSQMSPLPPPPPVEQQIPQDAGESYIPPQYIEKVRTLYPFVKDKDDELSFVEGQIIYVVKKNDDGWWEGVTNGVTGLFPANHVETC